MKKRRIVAAGALAASPLIASAPAWADGAYPPAGPTVQGVTVTRPAVVPQQAPTGLPFTGQNTALMSLVGAALVGTGGLVVVAARRRNRGSAG